MKRIFDLSLCFIVFAVFSATSLFAQVRPHHVFDNNMILQRDKKVKVWGWAEPGESVKVEFNGQVKSTSTTGKGEWELYLDPMQANKDPQDLIVSGSNSRVKFTNVLVGDVWILGGQSNMEFDLARIYHGDMEILSANFPEIRLLTIPRGENQKEQVDFERLNEYDSWYRRHDEKGYWFVCSPERVKTFSGLGYVFGRRLHMASGVPIGLVDASRGGTTIETWLSPEMLSKMPENAQLMKEWQDKVDAYDPEADLKKRIENWERRAEARKKQGQEPGPKPTEPSPSPALNHNYPGTCYNGMISVIAGLSAKGVLFHHGYNNALGDSRPKLYETNFKALVRDWRATFNDKNLPFGIVELSAGGQAQTLENFEVCMVDAAPFIREAQLNTCLDIENVDFICAYDQQVSWYHPQKKVQLGERSARWALATHYGYDLSYAVTELVDYEIRDDQIILQFSNEVNTFDDRPFDGFAMADESKHFYPAKAEYVLLEHKNNRPVYDKTKLVVRCEQVQKPVAVRYAWARNPLGNLVNARTRILPVPAFRTDSWDYPEAPYGNEQLNEHRIKLRNEKREAQNMVKQRMGKNEDSD